MDDFLKMDIFFAATTAVVLLGGAVLIVGLVYVVRILRNFDHLSRNISEESDHVRSDIAVLRSRIRDEGMKVKHWLDFFDRFSARRSRKKKTGE